MARTPEIDRADAEARLGPRGTATINTGNRLLARQWLTAVGVHSDIARAMLLDDMESAYNDTTDKELDRQRQLAPEHLERHLGKSNGAAQPAPSPTPGTGAAGKLASGIAGLLEEILARPAGLDEERVTELARGLINEELSSARIARLINEHAPTVTIKIERAEPREIRTEGARHEMFARIVRMVSTGSNTAIIGPAGSGKTTLAHQVADALGIPFEFTGAINSEYKLAGFMNAQGQYVSTAFRRAFEDGALFLFDEIDGSLPAALLAFNAALSNGYADFPDKRVPRHPNFRAVAAANTYWTGADRVYVGRNQLDGASLDRFGFIEMGYDERLERLLAGDTEWTTYVQRARRVQQQQKVRAIISPRASIEGGKLLAAGETMENVASAWLWKGLPSDDVAKIKAGMGV